MASSNSPSGCFVVCKMCGREFFSRARSAQRAYPYCQHCWPKRREQVRRESNSETCSVTTETAEGSGRPPCYAASFFLGLLIPGTIPDGEPNNDCIDLEFECREGWKVSVFYDVGDLDYINHFVTPDGAIVDFWDWPESDDKSALMNWRGHKA